MEGRLSGVWAKHKGGNSNVKPAAAAAPVSTDCVFEPVPKVGSSVCDPVALKVYAPFIRGGFVSLLGRDVKVPVTIWRDTGAYDSYLLESVLLLSAETASGDFILSRGMGMTVLSMPVRMSCLIASWCRGL